MARSQQADGRIVPVQLGAWAVDGVVRVSNSYAKGLDDLAKNVNTIWARRTPSLVSQQTPGMGDATTHNVRAFGVWETDLFTVQPPRFTWRLPLAAYGKRVLVGGRIRVSVATATQAQFRLYSPLSGNATITPISTTAMAWKTLQPVTVDPATFLADGTDLIELSARLSSGTGAIFVEAIELYAIQWTTELPIGLDTLGGYGFEPLDTRQFAGDSAFTAALRVVESNHDALMKAHTTRLLCHSIDRRTPSRTIGPVVLPWDLYNPFRANLSSDEERPMFGPMNYYPRTGEGVERLRFAALGYQDTDTTDPGALSVRSEVVRDDEVVFEYTVDRPLPEAAAPPDPSDPADWVDGVVGIGSDPAENTRVSLWGWVDSGAKPGYVGLYSMSLWTEER